VKHTTDPPVVTGPRKAMLRAICEQIDPAAIKACR